MATRGIMAENMFIGQSTLLQWLNGTLGLKLEKIEEVSGGLTAAAEKNNGWGRGSCQPQKQEN